MIVLESLSLLVVVVVVLYIVFGTGAIDRLIDRLLGNTKTVDDLNDTLKVVRTETTQQKSKVSRKAKALRDDLEKLEKLETKLK